MSTRPGAGHTEELDAGDLIEARPSRVVERARRDSLSGRTLGRYHICFELASGGMGSVYLAAVERGPGVDEFVAIKRMHSHLARQREFVEMFFDEARLAERIRHPAVCRVLDFGDDGGQPFLVMEYLIGEPLSAVLEAIASRGAPTLGAQHPRVVARLVAELSEGLHAVHKLTDDSGKPLDVIHRDITPQNLFALYDGTVRLTDFGVARTDDQLHETRTGVIKGKLAYTAPELFQRKPLDQRADVWSMGVVLWELLTGRRLIAAKADAEIIAAVLYDPILPPSHWNPEVSPELDEVVLKALARRPGARYATARALADDLRTAISDEGDVLIEDQVRWLDEIFPGVGGLKRGLVQQLGSPNFARQEAARVLGNPEPTPSAAGSDVQRVPDVTHAAHATARARARSPQLAVSGETGERSGSRTPAGVTTPGVRPTTPSPVPATDDSGTPIRLVPPPRAASPTPVARPAATPVAGPPLPALSPSQVAALSTARRTPTERMHLSARRRQQRALLWVAAVLLVGLGAGAVLWVARRDVALARSAAPPAVHATTPAASRATAPAATTPPAAPVAVATPSESPPATPAAATPLTELDIAVPPETPPEPARPKPRPTPSDRAHPGPRASDSGGDSEDPAPAPVPTTGEAFINTGHVVADIIYQGRVIGQAPRRVRFPVGHHTLTLRRPDGRETTVSFDVGAGQQAFVGVDLK